MARSAASPPAGEPGSHERVCMGSTQAGAAGHGKTFVIQRAVVKSPDNVFHLAANEWNDADMARNKQSFQVSGNGAADDQINVELAEPSSSLVRVCGTEPLSESVSTVLAFDVEQKDLLGEIKDRRNPTLPLWDGNPHVWIIRSNEPSAYVS